MKKRVLGLLAALLVLGSLAAAGPSSTSFGTSTSGSGYASFSSCGPRGC